MDNNIELKIVLNQVTGEVSLSGPLENKVMVYGLLESAKDAMRLHSVSNQPGKILPVLGALPAEPPGNGSAVPR